jgi:hypothetical protein
MTRVGFLLIEDRRWPGEDRRACLPMACTLPLRAKTLYARGSFALTSRRCWHVGRQGRGLSRSSKLDVHQFAVES